MIRVDDFKDAELPRQDRIVRGRLRLGSRVLRAHREQLSNNRRHGDSSLSRHRFELGVQLGVKRERNAFHKVILPYGRAESEAGALVYLPLSILSTRKRITPDGAVTRTSSPTRLPWTAA